MRGTLIHDMLELHIAGKDPWPVLKEAEKKYGKLFKQEQEHYGDILGDVKKMMEGYFEFYKQDPITYIKHKGQYTEHYFEVELTPSITLIGYLDSAGRTQDKLVWLVEHKSHKQLPEGDLNYSDLQSALYTWIMPKIGLPKPDGVAWNYIKAVAPTEPELLKNGELSKRANIASTWPVYLAAIRKHKLDPRDYKDMKEKLSNRLGDFYARKYLPVNKAIVEQLIEDTIKTAIEIKRKGHKDHTRNIDKHCTWCDFYNLCQAELRGADAAFIRKTNFTVQED